jgi:hypothetical protein
LSNALLLHKCFERWTYVAEQMVWAHAAATGAMLTERRRANWADIILEENEDGAEFSLFSGNILCMPKKVAKLSCNVSSVFLTYWLYVQ